MKRILIRREDLTNIFDSYRHAELISAARITRALKLQRSAHERERDGLKRQGVSQGEIGSRNN